MKTRFIIFVLLSSFLLIYVSSSNAQRLDDIVNNDTNTNINDNTNPAFTSESVINASQVTPESTSPVDITTMNTTSTGADTDLDPNVLLQQLQRPVVGSFGDDRISGTEQTDVIIGFSGSDTISGANGSDAIQGNEGEDKIYGDTGDDILQGGIGSDQLYGGIGDDILAAGADDDFISGEKSNDKIYGDLGDDILVGGDGADYFDCGEGVDVVADFNLQQGDDRAGNCEELIEQP